MAPIKAFKSHKGGGASEVWTMYELKPFFCDGAPNVVCYRRACLVMEQNYWFYNWKINVNQFLISCHSLEQKNTIRIDEWPALNVVQFQDGNKKYKAGRCGVYIY